MIVTDDAKASEYLAHIGYYRLSAYWYPFRLSKSVIQPNGSTSLIVENTFKAGTHFQTIVDLYVFDKRLRLLLLDALERIEIALRTSVALQLGQYNPWAYRQAKYFEPKFVTHPRHSHAVWLQRFDDTAQQSKEQFAEHFRQKYNALPFPIWIAVELLDFGPLSHLLSGMRYRYQQSIASHYGIPRPQLLASWVRTLSYVRNICAHHARLWNKPFVDQPKLSKLQEIPEFDHILAYPAAQSRLYIGAAIMRFMLRSINPSTSWTERLKTHLRTFPQNQHVSFSGSGFPPDWAKERLWQS